MYLSEVVNPGSGNMALIPLIGTTMSIVVENEQETVQQGLAVLNKNLPPSKVAQLLSIWRVGGWRLHGGTAETLCRRNCGQPVPESRRARKTRTQTLTASNDHEPNIFAAVTNRHIRSKIGGLFGKIVSRQCQ
jgi:hypothetical protein